MTTVKLKFRPSTVPDKDGNFRIIRNRAVGRCPDEYRSFSDEWETSAPCIVLPSSAVGKRHPYFISSISAAAGGQNRIKNTVRQLRSAGTEYASNMNADKISSADGNDAFIAFGRSLSSRLKQLGRIRCSETYHSSLNSLERFLKGEDIAFDMIDGTLMQEYEMFLKESGVCRNTSSYYMRNLRAIYNRAVDKDLTIQRYPFKHVYTGIDKTVKRAIALETLRQIRDLDLTPHPVLDFARDVFMFSFYTRGMSFIDMAFLKHDDLRGGMLSYRKKKTGQQIFIRWEKPMQDIVNKYETSDMTFMLPIIKREDVDYRKQYVNAAHSINNGLRKLGECLRLPVPLTCYAARHTWASLARSRNIPLSVISEALGHDSERTTQIYMASLDSERVDKANSIVLNSL